MNVTLDVCGASQREEEPKEGRRLAPVERFGPLKSHAKPRNIFITYIYTVPSYRSQFELELLAAEIEKVLLSI